MQWWNRVSSSPDTKSIEVKFGRLLLYMDETSAHVIAASSISAGVGRHRDIPVHFENCVTEAHEGRVGEKSVESWHCLREKPNHISSIPVRIQGTRTMAFLG